MNNPFDEQFVIKVTLNNMKKAVDFSIDKTFARVQEFADDPIKSNEVFTTLARLHGIRNSIESNLKSNTGNTNEH
jgi:hypothetical protein